MTTCLDKTRTCSGQTFSAMLDEFRSARPEADSANRLVRALRRRLRTHTPTRRRARVKAHDTTSLLHLAIAPLDDPALSDVCSERRASCARVVRARASGARAASGSARACTRSRGWLGHCVCFGRPPATCAGLHTLTPSSAVASGLAHCRPVDSQIPGGFQSLVCPIVFSHSPSSSSPLRL